MWTMAGTRLPETLSTSSCRHIIAWQNCGALLCAVAKCHIYIVVVVYMCVHRRGDAQVITAWTGTQLYQAEHADKAMALISGSACRKSHGMGAVAPHRSATHMLQEPQRGRLLGICSHDLSGLPAPSKWLAGHVLKSQTHHPKPQSLFPSTPKVWRGEFSTNMPLGMGETGIEVWGGGFEIQGSWPRITQVQAVLGKSFRLQQLHRRPGYGCLRPGAGLVFLASMLLTTRRLSTSRHMGPPRPAKPELWGQKPLTIVCGTMQQPSLQASICQPCLAAPADQGGVCNDCRLSSSSCCCQLFPPCIVCRCKGGLQGQQSCGGCSSRGSF